MDLDIDPRDSNADGRGRNFDEIKRDLSQSLLALKKPTDFVTTLIYCISILVRIPICLEAKIFQHLAAQAQIPELLRSFPRIWAPPMETTRKRSEIHRSNDAGRVRSRPG